jgi:hypothetical protein
VKHGRVVLLLAVALVVLGATAGVVIGRQRLGGPATTTVAGVVGSEKLRFLRDPEVVRAFARNGIALDLEAEGSRRMSTMDLDRFDFAFPGSAQTAAQVTRRRTPIGDGFTPFSSPLAVATFSPIVDLLTTAGIVRRAGDGHQVLDVAKYLEAVNRDLRWDQIEGNVAYPFKRTVLLATTRPRHSNSAAMYAALVASLTGGDVGRVAKVFAGQGAVDVTSEEPFERYLTRRLDFAPTVLVYEAQYVDRAAAGDPSITPDRQLVYLSPTVLSAHTVVPFTEAGGVVGRLLTTDPALQDLAARHGFRTADPARFQPVLAKVRSGDAPLPVALTDLVTPPGPDDLETLLTAVEERLA